MKNRTNPQAGFSLIELMIAMVVTVIITGAMFGLLTSGQSAFRTQPERTDRQQNMRMAMDVIMRDVQSAGVGMPNFVQAFARNLDARGPGNGPTGLAWDELEILANTSGFGPEEACHTPGGGSSSEVRLKAGSSYVTGGPVMIFFWDGTYTVMYVTDTTTNKTGANNCDSGVDHSALNFNSGKGDPSGMNLAGGVCQPNAYGVGNAGTGSLVLPECGGKAPCCDVNFVTAGSVVHYRIQLDANNYPNLMRSENGGPFQMLARGIEDLQVQYVQADGTLNDNAPQVLDPLAVGAPGAYNSLITQARVTLSARATTERLQGATTSASAGTALRGSLQSQASPRQALWTVTQESPAPVTPKWN